MFPSLRRWVAVAFAAPAFAFAQAPPPTTLAEVPVVAPSPVVVLPPAVAPAAAPCDKCAADAKPEKPPFADVPPVQPLPRPGVFAIPPSGEGYEQRK